MLDTGKNNYTAAVCEVGGVFSVAFADVTTGEFSTLSFEKGKEAKIIDELARINPSEVIINDTPKIAASIENLLKIKPEVYNPWVFKFDAAKHLLISHFGIQNLDGFGLTKESEICAAGALMQYFYETQKNTLSHILKITPVKNEKYMLLDVSTRRNLELTSTIRGTGKSGSLLEVLDKTKTAMGARLLRKWLEQPLIIAREINLRLDAVAQWKQNLMARDELRIQLAGVYDIERLAGRIAYQTATARDLVALKNSAGKIPAIKEIISRLELSLVQGMNAYFADNMDSLSDLFTLIETTLCDEPAIGLKDGGIIRDGYSDELDKLRAAKTNGAQWLLTLETNEREATGIKNLKIRYNKVFGYYIEVTNSHLPNVPERYVRRQTLANCERYVTEKLKEIETAILSAEDKLGTLEYEIFVALRNKVANELNRIMATANCIACLDTLQSLAEAADKNNYSRPFIYANSESKSITIKNGRHPVVERAMDGRFVPNDTTINGESERLAVITGPNMAGKSTYMRQVALIVLMAQIGSFVPANEARLCVCDRIFTRIGASDDLAAGQSTFMLEMSEMANILNNATENSLIIVDEVGRGTSTTDGLAIAQAVMEHIADKTLLGAKTLFATHFHELAALESEIDGVVNYCLQVKEDGENVVFMRKIVKGNMDRSYGIHVARLAGVPAAVVNRARFILGEQDSIQAASKIYDVDDDVVDYGRKNKSKGNSSIINDNPPIQ